MDATQARLIFIGGMLTLVAAAVVVDRMLTALAAWWHARRPAGPSRAATDGPARRGAEDRGLLIRQAH
jgi:hypothetical protein